MIWKNQLVQSAIPLCNKKMGFPVGEKIISPEKAIEYAKMWIEKRRLDKKTSYKILQRKGIINLNPILVREQSKGKKEGSIIFTNVYEPEFRAVVRNFEGLKEGMRRNNKVSQR